MNNTHIGENIRIYRKRKNITQRELGDKIGKTWEMVSRYERGVSSPSKQINSLADALDIDIKDLFRDPAEKDTEKHYFNRVPLFTYIPENADFKKERSFVYYTAPDWILDIDNKCFVITTDLATIQTDRIIKGKLFVSPNSECFKGDLVLKKENEKLVAEELKEERREEIVGKILAEEIAF